MYVHMDFEAFSVMDIRTCGAYRYALDPSTEPLLLSWARDDAEPVDTWRADVDLLGVCPPDLVELIEGGATFAAWNAQMERAMWHYIMHQKHGWPDIPLRQWYCTAAQAAALALPRALENAGAAMNAPVEFLKDKARGTKLINIFCKPRKPTKRDPRVRVTPTDRPEEWLEFIEYNRQDVVGEKYLFNRMPKLPAREVNIWRFDTKINERGLPIDVPLVRKALNVARELERRNEASVRLLTATVENPSGYAGTQNEKIKEWLDGEGVELDNLQRKPLEEFLALHGKQLPDNVREVLELRIEGARVSVKKLLTMLHVVCEDARVRGVFLFWGARTGRWSGKLIQPHNYVRGLFTKFLRDWILELLGLEDPIDQITDVGMLMEGAGPLKSLSYTMRGFIAAPCGRVLYVVDYANIESRIVVWLARQEDVLELYRNKVDLYRWMGGHVYGKDPKDVTSEERRCSKHIVLGCGFGMGPPKFVWTCKEVGGFDISLEFAKICVKMYRTKMPKVKNLWYDMDAAAVECVRTGRPTVLKQGRVKFFLEGDFLRMELPSGRLLSYPYPKLYPGEYGDEVTYMSEHPKTHQWVRESTYGGKLVENAVQAIARDIMVEGMIHAEKSGYEVDGTVHDEILTERDEGTGNVHEFERIVCRLPQWADGCPIAAEAFTAKRWRKQ